MTAAERVNKSDQRRFWQRKLFIAFLLSVSLDSNTGRNSPKFRFLALPRSCFISSVNRCNVNDSTVRKVNLRLYWQITALQSSEPKSEIPFLPREAGGETLRLMGDKFENIVLEVVEMILKELLLDCRWKRGVT